LCHDEGVVAGALIISQSIIMLVTDHMCWETPMSWCLSCQTPRGG